MNSSIKTTTSGSTNKVSRWVHLQASRWRSGWYHLLCVHRGQSWKTVVHFSTTTNAGADSSMVQPSHGRSRWNALHETLQQCFQHPKLLYTIDKFICKHCLWHKLSGKCYGLLPEQEMWIASWEEVSINLISPWTVKVNNRKVKFNMLMCMDTPSIGWVDSNQQQTLLHICTWNKQLIMYCSVYEHDELSQSSNLYWFKRNE
jgi:hypothetical protein